MSAATFSPLSDEDAKSLQESLELLKERACEVCNGETLAFDDRSLKPLQQLLSGQPDQDLVRAAEYGLGEILQREFDLDWVSATREDDELIGLNIPCTPNVLFPSDFFSVDIESGKPVNVRVAYIEWAEWIEEHAFD